MKVSFEVLTKIGEKYRKQLEVHMADRYLIEQQWLRNLRQYQATYDSDILARIPDDKSRAYPRYTRMKVKGGVAKMMEMAFPAKKRNWSLTNSPNPSIPKEALDAIIEQLNASSQESGQPVSAVDVEVAVNEFAEARKKKMEDEIADQLADAKVDYVNLCRKAMLSGHVYGPGFARCPMVRTQEISEWKLNEATGTWGRDTKKVRRPYPEFVRCWDLYPDLSAKTWEDQSLIFERFVLNRLDFEGLMKRADFNKEAIKQYLKEHPTGNYVPQSYETDLQTIQKTANVSSLNARNYELYRGLGFVCGAELAELGADIKDDEQYKTHLADFWIIDNIVIKAVIAPFGERPSDQYHIFVYADDEDAPMTGIGLPEDVRDSQMGICASTRAMFDHMAATVGPVYETNEDLLAPGSKSMPSIRPFDVLHRRNEMPQDANYPALRVHDIPSHLPDIMAVLQDQRRQLDDESYPSFTLGNNQQPLGEAFRTSNNMSMMMGGANIPQKDIMRAFDRFTASIIGAMLQWNMEFNPNKEIKGDYSVSADGVNSLVAKEVRGAALDQFVATLTDKERAYFDEYKLLVRRLEARDLSEDELLPREKAEQVIEGMQQQAAQAAEIEQGLTAAKTQDLQASAAKKQVEADVKGMSAEVDIQEKQSRIGVNEANAGESESRVQLANFKTLMDTASGLEGRAQDGSAGGQGSGASGMVEGA